MRADLSLAQAPLGRCPEPNGKTCTLLWGWSVRQGAPPLVAVQGGSQSLGRPRCVVRKQGPVGRVDQLLPAPAMSSCGSPGGGTPSMHNSVQALKMTGLPSSPTSHSPLPGVWPAPRLCFMFCSSMSRACQNSGRTQASPHQECGNSLYPPHAQGLPLSCPPGS